MPKIIKKLTEAEIKNAKPKDTSNPDHPSSMERWNDLTALIRRSSTSFSPIKVMSIWKKNLMNGSASTTFQDHMALIKEKHPMKY